MRRLISTYRLVLIVLLIDTGILLANRSTGTIAFQKTYYNFKEMFGVIPPVFVLLGLLDVWVPRSSIIKYLGEGSGLRGIVLSIVLGAAAAGPLYGAFPVAAMMMKKGSRFLNVAVFLYSWSTLKLPMFLFEMSALGVKFALTRYAVNIPGILVMAYILDKSLSPQEKNEIYLKHAEEGIA